MKFRNNIYHMKSVTSWGWKENTENGGFANTNACANDDGNWTQIHPLKLPTQYAARNGSTEIHQKTRLSDQYQKSCGGFGTFVGTNPRLFRRAFFESVWGHHYSKKIDVISRACKLVFRFCVFSLSETAVAPCQTSMAEIWCVYHVNRVRFGVIDVSLGLEILITSHCL